MSLEKYCNKPCQSDYCNCNSENLGDIMELNLVDNIEIKDEFVIDKIDESANSKILPFDSNEAKNWLLYILKTSKVKITFEKVDGSERIMMSTLMPSLLPKIKLKDEDLNKPIKEKKESTTTFRVFDTEKQEFRSVRWNSIKSINFEI